MNPSTDLCNKAAYRDHQNRKRFWCIIVPVSISRFRWRCIPKIQSDRIPALTGLPAHPFARGAPGLVKRSDERPTRTKPQENKGDPAARSVARAARPDRSPSPAQGRAAGENPAQIQSRIRAERRRMTGRKTARPVGFKSPAAPIPGKTGCKTGCESGSGAAPELRGSAGFCDFAKMVYVTGY